MRLVELTEQVLDRVEYRRCVRFDGDQITAPHEPKEQRGHDRHDRGARRLMASDLDLVRPRPLVIGMVDLLSGQPQHATLDTVQNRSIITVGSIHHHPRCV